MATDPSSRPWGFIGLGEMGEPMAVNLLSHGLDVIVFDRSSERVRLVASRGAAAAGSVVAVAEAADVVSVCVRDAQQLEQVLSDGLAEAVPSGALVVVHSTVGPGPCRRAAERLTRRGVTLLDAPVSGMRMAALAGTLTFFVGGSAQALDRARRGLEAMGAATLHVGDVGAGQVVKIANNLVAFATVGLVDEVAALAAAAGVEEDRLLAALASGSARSWVIDNWRFLRTEWPNSQPGGASAVREIVGKDLGLALATAADLGVDAHFASLAERLVPALLGPSLTGAAER